MTKSVFRSVALMLMITMLYTESVKNSTFLIELKLEANATKLKVLSSQLDRYVCKVSDSRHPCQSKFFCLAEQVLNNVSLPEVSKLYRKLKEYNKAGNFSCRRINGCTEYHLSTLIEGLHTCAASRLASSK